ncbi:MAG: hypothetical protein ACI9DF_004166 [Verrucomicrobiales bacterium]|jgi:hypothetical protein
MRVGEKHASIGQSRDVRCLSLGMTTKRRNPIIQVIDRDEKDVRLVLGATDGSGDEAEEKSEPKHRNYEKKR